MQKTVRLGRIKPGWVLLERNYETNPNTYAVVDGPKVLRGKIVVAAFGNGEFVGMETDGFMYRKFLVRESAIAAVVTLR